MLELGKAVLTIGRGTANDLVLNDTSVSRFHAVIKRKDGGGFDVADRGSTNGVVINGARIGDETALRHGDRVRIGVYTLYFEQVNEASLVVKKAAIPVTVDQVLKRDGPQITIRPPRPVGEESTQSALLETVRRLERENYLLSVLYDAGKALNSKLSIDSISSQVMDLGFRIEGVERGFMMLFDEQGSVWRETEVKYRKGPAPGSEQQIILSQTILERMKEEQQPILITDVSEDERFSGSESMKISGLRSAMCAPLVGAQRLLGILYVDNMQRKSAFTPEELNVFALVAAQAAAAIDNASAHEQLAESAIQRSALERFLSPEVVEMISANPEGVRLGGVNQKVSVMFADIRGFTRMSENLKPEQVVEILNEYFTRVTDVIFDNGGTLDKYIGDAVMAVFGAPISKGNDALNAVRAACELESMVTEMNRDAKSRRWPELGVGIGINTGIVTAGNIGSPRRLDYTVIGDAVNTASRLMNNARGGQVIISESTAAELAGNFPLAALPPLTLKGKVEPVPAFEVLWKKRAAGN